MAAPPSSFQFDAQQPVDHADEATLRPGPQQLRARRLAALDRSETHRRDTEVQPQPQPVPNTEVQPQAVPDAEEADDEELQNEEAEDEVRAPLRTGYFDQLLPGPAPPTLQLDELAMAIRQRRGPTCACGNRVTVRLDGRSICTRCFIMYNSAHDPENNHNDVLVEDGEVLITVENHNIAGRLDRYVFNNTNVGGIMNMLVNLPEFDFWGWSIDQMRLFRAGADPQDWYLDDAEVFTENTTLVLLLVPFYGPRPRRRSRQRQAARRSR